MLQRMMESLVRKYTFVVLAGLLILSGSIVRSNRRPPSSFKSTSTPTSVVTPVPTKGGGPTATRTPTRTNTPTATDTVSITDTPTLEVTPTYTLEPTITWTPTNTLTPTITPTPTQAGTITPYPSAPLCSDVGPLHDNSKFHTLWDAVRGCHYDHEHGQNPFVSQVAFAFAPLGDLRTLLGGVEIGHTNPSSSHENTDKHGGFKWTISLAPNYLPAPSACVVGFEGAQNCVIGAVIQHHGFGDANQELEASNGTRIHSVAALIKMGPPSDPGYAYLVQHVEYGEIAASYQGAVVPYPQNFTPLWNPAFGPYWTTPCIGSFVNQAPSTCAASLQDLINRGDADWIVTSKVTGTLGEPRPLGSTLFKLLWRARDAYQALDTHDLSYPLDYLWLCSNDDGATYDPTGCRYNNSTARVHEIGGTIPMEWDGLEGFDTDPRSGRITAEGFVTRFGDLNFACTEVGISCFPVKLVGAYVGTYGGTLSSSKISDTTPFSNPERDIYFCNGTVCNETVPDAVSSGWIEDSN